MESGGAAVTAQETVEQVAMTVRRQNVVATVCFVLVVLILAAGLLNAVYHAGWIDGFAESQRIYSEHSK